VRLGCQIQGGAEDQQARLEAAQADLKKVLSTKQEAQALLLGLVN